jgi:acetyl-CoA C-acetyltransferase
MEDVAIGGSTTKLGNRDAWIRELLAEAGEACPDDDGVSPDDVGHVYVSNTASGAFDGQTGVMDALALGAFELDKEG